MSSQGAGQPLADSPRTTWHRLLRWGVGAVAATAMLWLSSPAIAAPADSPPPTAPLEQLQALVQPAVVYEQITCTGYVYDETNKGYFTEDPFTVSYQSLKPGWARRAPLPVHLAGFSSNWPSARGWGAPPRGW